VGNALQLRKDTLVTQGITVIFLIIFLALYFRKASAPLLILLPAVFGAVFALAMITLIKGSISVIALGTGSVILGIAVNYSLHLLNHARHETSMEQVLRDLSHPMTIGSITTVGGFLCMLWLQSELLRDLGLFGAFSLIGAALFSLIFLPQFVSIKKTNAVHHDTWLDRLAAKKMPGRQYMVWLILICTVFFAFHAGKVAFEPNMNRMNYMSDKLKKAEQQVNALNAFALQSVYLVSAGKDMETALQKNEEVVQKLQALAKTGTVRKFSGVAALLASEALQKKRINDWQNYWTAEKKLALQQLLQTEGTAIGFSAKAFLPVDKMLNSLYLPLPDTVQKNLSAGLLQNYIIRQDTGIKLLTLVKTTPENKAAVYAAFEGFTGTIVLDMQYVTSRLVDMVQQDFSNISWMAALLVFLVLLISFGRIELTLMAFIPMLITWIWILGIMALLHIPFNIVNIIISALIFALGDDYSLFTLDGLLQQYKTGKNNSASFTASIFLSAITTIAGLGVLIFAKHPSLRSIAFIAITGILCVVLISQVMIPVLFRALITNRTNKGRAPLTAWSIFTSVFAFLYFTIGAILLSIVALFLLRLNPFATEKTKYQFHVLLSAFISSLVYIMVNVKKTVLNTGHEDFSKPAVIISNHQSFLDILVLIMLHPKIILMTNDWVWRSPIFGFVVRMAGYFPAAKGIENNLSALRGQFKQGYSIAVFPEGTRSPDGEMKRFHKGAFYLAEQLQADILPVLLHGTGDTMGKGDFLLKDGHLVVEILPRINLANKNYGEGYTEQAKLISRYFKLQHQQKRAVYENGKWFRKKLLANYLYKGPALEWYIRIKTSIEKNYQQFIDAVPKKGRILDIGCGYGALSYMLHFTGRERQLKGIDFDEEKIRTAANCFSQSDAIRFACADVLDFGDEFFDCFILSDVLHYLAPEKQEQLLNKCMRQLLPGGKVIIREGNSELTSAHQKTKLTEFFSIRLFRFNQTESSQLHFLSGTQIREIAAAAAFECNEIKDSNFTSNSIFILSKKPNADGS
jgi:uncharacterized protein